MIAPSDILERFHTIAVQQQTFALEVDSANLKLAEIGRRGGHTLLEGVTLIRESLNLRQQLTRTKSAKILEETRQPNPNLGSIRRKMDQVIKQGAIIRREVARYKRADKFDLGRTRWLAPARSFRQIVKKFFLTDRRNSNVTIFTFSVCLSLPLFFRFSLHLSSA
jgi:hypothetical protein